MYSAQIMQVCVKPTAVTRKESLCTRRRAEIVVYAEVGFGYVCVGGVKNELVYTFPLLIDVMCRSIIVVCSVFGGIECMFEGVPVGSFV